MPICGMIGRLKPFIDVVSLPRLVFINDTKHRSSVVLFWVKLLLSGRVLQHFMHVRPVPSRSVYYGASC